MQVLDGKKVAAFHCSRVECQLNELHKQGIRPELAMLLIGDDEPSAIYAASMKRVANSVGLTANIYRQDLSAQEDDIIAMIKNLNEKDSVYGILPMMPLPKKFNAVRIVNSIAPSKDVDGLTDANIARLFTSRPGFIPCTPRAVMAVFDYYHIPLTGKKVVIIGRSNIVGKPLAQLCLNRNATVTHCHTRTQDLRTETVCADILISAAGCTGLIGADMVKPGATVIDVGINRLAGKTVGDVVYDEVAKIAGAITPVPGGIGSVTTMMMLENVVCGQISAK